MALRFSTRRGQSLRFGVGQRRGHSAFSFERMVSPTAADEAADAGPTQPGLWLSSVLVPFSPNIEAIYASRRPLRKKRSPRPLGSSCLTSLAAITAGICGQRNGVGDPFALQKPCRDIDASPDRLRCEQTEPGQRAANAKGAWGHRPRP
jgi:hypothetical protein